MENAIETNNEIDENKIHYRRMGWGSLGWGDDSESDDDDIIESDDDCPECFEEISDYGITQEYGRPRHHSNYRYGGGNYRDYFDGLQDNMHHHRKDGVGETIMSDEPIRSQYGQGGRSSFGGGNSRGFSFDFNDFRRSPTARHFETKGHRSRHSGYDEYDDFDEFDTGFDEDDLFENAPRK